MSDPTYRQLSPVLRRVTNEHADRIEFWCPGCDEEHFADVLPPNRWTWNEDVVSPTFRPSVLTEGLKVQKDDNGRWTGGWVLDSNKKPIPVRCHLFVTNGNIVFQSDCTHALAGQTVPLPEWNTHETDSLPSRPKKEQQP